MLSINNFEEYKDNALKTKSDTDVNFYGDKISLQTLSEAVEGFIKYGNLLDQIKRTLFYGKQYPNLNVLGNVIDYDNVKLNGLSLDTIHGILGAATESVEQVELLRNVVINNEPFDLLNYKEELGDTFWYLAIALESIKTPPTVIWSQNIAKLQARYPDKFSTESANVRDLNKEHKVLASFEEPTVTSITSTSPETLDKPTKVNKRTSISN